MFSKNKKSNSMAKNNELDSNTINLIGIGTKITGDVTSSGDLRIDGVLKGNISTKGKLVVGQTGTITGEINCKNSDISGTINGKIVVSELLSLKSTAKIYGDIITNKLAIEPGSVFTGTCNMDGKTPINEKQKTEKFTK